MALSAETAVKKLARQAENCICPNCGTYSKYGFNTVCIKYLTFVCNLCKTAHQAVSHRCKSLTMSSWDQGEVLKLKKNGNEVARNTWLASAPEPGVGGRPKEGDDVNIFKRFVIAVYEEKKYYQNNNDSSTSKEVSVKTETPVIISSNVGNDSPHSTATVDLLDFSVNDSCHVSKTQSSRPHGEEIFGNFADVSCSPSQQQISSSLPIVDLFDAAAPTTGSTTHHQKGGEEKSAYQDNEEEWADFADFSQAQVPSTLATTTQSNTRDAFSLFDVQHTTSAFTSVTPRQEEFGDFVDYSHAPVADKNNVPVVSSETYDWLSNDTKPMAVSRKKTFDPLLEDSKQNDTFSFSDVHASLPGITNHHGGYGNNNMIMNNMYMAHKPSSIQHHAPYNQQQGSLTIEIASNNNLMHMRNGFNVGYQSTANQNFNIMQPTTSSTMYNNTGMKSSKTVRTSDGNDPFAGLSF